MTDREKLVALLENISENHAPCGMGVVAEQLLANGVTFATDTNDGSKWISVEDDKPAEFVSVLGHMTDAGEFPTVRECYRIVEEAFFFPALGSFHPVDKWMEMPKEG